MLVLTHSTSVIVPVSAREKTKTGSNKVVLKMEHTCEQCLVPVRCVWCLLACFLHLFSFGMKFSCWVACFFRFSAFIRLFFVSSIFDAIEMNYTNLPRTFAFNWTFSFAAAVCTVYMCFGDKLYFVSSQNHLPWW